MKQAKLFKSQSPSREHGGNLKSATRRRKRPLSPKLSHHVVLRSDFARGARNLLRNYQLVQRILRRSSRRFRIRIYEKAVVGNHIHLLVKGQTREDLQNFFRVFAGHLAQQILILYPLKPGERSAVYSREKLPPRGAHQNPKQAPEPRKAKRENKFWETRIYSKVVSWGREFREVTAYVIKNTKEALGLISYEPRRGSSRLARSSRSNSRVSSA